jgi:hypothetical protein
MDTSSGFHTQTRVLKRSLWFEKSFLLAAAFALTTVFRQSIERHHSIRLPEPTLTKRVLSISARRTAFLASLNIPWDSLLRKQSLAARVMGLNRNTQHPCMVRR